MARHDDEFPSLWSRETDMLSNGPSGARQDDGGPYRSRAAALVARRCRLAAERDALTRAIARRERVVARLRAVDAELARLVSPDLRPARSWSTVAQAAAMVAAAIATSFALGIFASVLITHPSAVARPSVAVVAPPPREPTPQPSVVQRGDVFEISGAAVPLLFARAVREPLVVEPLARDGQLVGTRLYDVESGSVLESLGLRDGDTIVSVDGAPMRGAADVARVYADLKVRHDVDVVLERAGQLRALHYLEVPTI